MGGRLWDLGPEGYTHGWVLWAVQGGPGLSGLDPPTSPQKNAIVAFFYYMGETESQVPN